MPRNNAPNPLYAGPRYNNPDVAGIGNNLTNIAGMLLANGPNAQALAASEAALREAQEFAAREGGRESGTKADIAGLLLEDARFPAETARRRVTGRQGLTPEELPYYETASQARFNPQNPKQIGEAEIYNFAQSLGVPEGLPGIARATAASKGDALVDGTDYTIRDKFTSKQPLVTPLGKQKNATEAAQAESYRAAGRKSDAEAVNKTAVDGLDAKSRQKLIMSRPKSAAALQKFLTNTDETIKLSMDILEVPEGQRTGNLDPVQLESGVGGAAGPESLLANIPWTPQADKKALVDRLLARSGFNELFEMRQSSPTGGALGNVTEKELYYLQIAATALQNSQGKAQFSRELVNYINRLREAKQNMANAYNEQYGALDAGQTGGSPAPAERKVTRTGTKNGKKVVQYDDGTIEEAP